MTLPRTLTPDGSPATTVQLLRELRKELGTTTRSYVPPIPREEPEDEEDEEDVVLIDEEGEG